MMSKTRSDNTGPGDSLPEDDQACDDKTLWEDLGVPPPPHLEGGPPVDGELVLAYERNELSREVRFRVHRLLDSFRGWEHAHTQVLLERVRTAEYRRASEEADA